MILPTSLAILFLVFGFGAIFGSFLNVVVFRRGTGRSVVFGRSACLHCNHALAATDLVPIVSYLVLRGKCRYCHAKFSAQYPIVEALAGIISLTVFLQSTTIGGWLLWSLVWLVALWIAVYDLRHMIIPVEATGLFAALALIVAGTVSYSHTVSLVGSDIWAYLVAGALLALPLFLFAAVSGGRWMGFADAPLEFSLGILLGFSAGLTALVFAFWFGAVAGFVLMFLSAYARKTLRAAGAPGRFTMKSEVPFAPFLILGAFVVYLTHVDLFASLPYLL